MLFRSAHHRAPPRSPCAHAPPTPLAPQERLLLRGETSGRTDDNEATILKRFATFKEQSLPVVALLEEKGVMSKIDASADPDEVFVASCAAYDKAAAA